MGRTTGNSGFDSICTADDFVAHLRADGREF
jgi:hypothetical protein